MSMANSTTGVDCMMKQDAGCQAHAQRVPQPYETPQLTLYGEMSALTATGTGPSESGSSPSSMACFPTFKSNGMC